MNTRMLYPTASNACFLPRRGASRRDWEPSELFFVWLAAPTASTNARRSHWFFFVVPFRRRLPADSSFPGQIPAHKLRWCPSGNTDMSTPTSAITFSIVVRFTPAIACKRPTGQRRLAHRQADGGAAGRGALPATALYPGTAAGQAVVAPG